MKGNRTERYCGSAEQWKDLQTRVGFRCRRVGKKDELCATASDWKRFDLARATQGVLDGRSYRDEATESAAQNHPLPTFTGPTMGAPLNAPAPPPPPPPPPAN